MSERPRRYQAFFAELKRRNVFKVAAFYGGAAFVVLQVVDLVVPALNLPASVMTAAVVLTVLALPIALDEAEQAGRLGAALVGEDPASYATLVRAAENPELKSEALGILRTATDEKWELSPGARAYWYTLLGEHELALDALTLVVDKGLGNVTFFNDALVDPLRDDSRFQELLERVGLAR